MDFMDKVGKWGHSYLSYFLYWLGKVPLMRTSEPGQKKVAVFSLCRMAVTQIWEKGNRTLKGLFITLPVLTQS